MADVAASANDPIFLNHHAMVDCIFETWLQKNPNSQYPISDDIPKGHRYDDYIVPFFPLYKHRDMFSTADKFGYHCKIQPVPFIKQPLSEHEVIKQVIIGFFVTIFSEGFCILILIFICACCYKAYKAYKARRNRPTCNNNLTLVPIP